MSKNLIPFIEEDSDTVYDTELILEKVAKKYKLPKSFILKLIENRYIMGTDLSRFDKKLPVVIDEQSLDKLKVLSENPEYRDKVIDFNPSYFYDYCPDLIEYHVFHDFIDRFCWLIKLYYADRSIVKNKKYKLDILFQNYLIKNKITNQRISKNLKGRYSEKSILFHLKKGWYNELVRSLPLDVEYLNIGTNIPGNIPDATSVSWNITQTYYSVYEYINSINFCTTDKLNTVQHRKPSKYFNANVIDGLKRSAMGYPFTLTSEKNLGIKYPKHIKFEYARYPRNSSQSIQEVTKDVTKMLKKIKLKQDSRASLIDFLYDFRVWANYTGIETIVKLENGFLLNYLYKNLGIINFFIAGSSELCALRRLGEDKYLEELRLFSEQYILKQSQYTKKIHLVPVFVRHRIYKHLGLIKGEMSFLFLNADPINFVDLFPKIKKSKKNVVKREREDFKEFEDLHIYELAKIIKDDWGKVYISARPYLSVMERIVNIEDYYGAENGVSVIRYFLVNAGMWRGEKARKMKKYLNNLLKKYDKRK